MDDGASMTEPVSPTVTPAVADAIDKSVAGVPAAGQLDLSLTDNETWTDDKPKTNTEDVGVKIGLGDGVTLSADFKIDPLDADDRSVSVGITKRFTL